LRRPICSLWPRWILAVITPSAGVQLDAVASSPSLSSFLLSFSFSGRVAAVSAAAADPGAVVPPSLARSRSPRSADGGGAARPTSAPWPGHSPMAAGQAAASRVGEAGGLCPRAGAMATDARAVAGSRARLSGSAAVACLPDHGRRWPTPGLGAGAAAAATQV
jgi:hypothetical protein